MGIAEDVGKLSGNAADFVISFLKAFPQHQNSFPNYKGKAPDSLKSDAVFCTHVNKVVNKLASIATKTGDALKAEAATLAKMPQHVGLTAGQFKDMVAHVGGYLPGADKAAWTGLANSLEAGLKAGGMK